MPDTVSAPERNIAAFNLDTAAHGGYVYTSNDQWSSRYATGRQSDELIRMLTGNTDPTTRIVDIGCGDGTFTLDIAERFHPASVRGIDPAANAITAAGRRIPAHLADLVSYEVGDIYSLKSRGEQLAIARGVLHHLDRPREAIAQLAREFTSVLALEPNGYNPVMKVIEKASAYHRQHDEKSYWPPDLDRWFKHEGFSVLSRKFFCVVPYFCPTPAARLLASVESTVERVPVVRQVCCGTNLVLYKRV
jgi:ubiquinone/menaquinone biosynthesis C-methylase UbiE